MPSMPGTFVFPTSSRKKEGSAVWIETDSKSRCIVDATKLDTIYVHYKGSGNYAVIGTIRDRDISLKTFHCEKDATDYVNDLKMQLE